jgi:hypothetical protein
LIEAGIRAKAAKLLQADTLTAAVGMVGTGEADAFAAPRVELFGLSAQVPGSRVLDGAFALSGYAASVPKGHAGHLAFVSDFLEQAKGVYDLWYAAVNGVPETLQATSTPVVPLPGALPLFASGLVGLGLLGWRRKKKATAA